MKWRSITTVIDIESGEIVTQLHVRKGKYIVVKKEVKNIKISETYGERQIKWYTRPNRQTKLEL